MINRSIARLLTGVTLLSMSTSALALTVPAPSENEGKVTIRAAAIRTETIPGETVAVTVEIWNHDTRTQHDLTVSLHANDVGITLPQALPQDGTFASPNTALWTVDELFAGRTWRVTVPVTIQPNTKAGTTMSLTARIAGDDINPETSVLSAQTTLGVAVLPPTGSRLDLLAVIVISITAAIAATVVHRKTVR
jgi:uncharacterized membrane protein